MLKFLCARNLQVVAQQRLPAEPKSLCVTRGWGLPVTVCRCVEKAILYYARALTSVSIRLLPN